MVSAFISGAKEKQPTTAVVAATKNVREKIRICTFLILVFFYEKIIPFFCSTVNLSSHMINGVIQWIILLWTN